MANEEPLERVEIDANELYTAHPPRMRHPHKKKVLELCAQTPLRGTIRHSRWAARTLPERVTGGDVAATVQPRAFDYAGGDAGVWHLNFADPQLFYAYGSPLLAQDELQVLEHPALASLRELLMARKLPAVTEEGGRPTPVLVAGVERRCILDTAPSVDRPRGLYGNLFAVAPFEVVASALTVPAQPTSTNVIAMAAPMGLGPYTRAQLEGVLVTAYTAFAAAYDESARLWPGQPVEVRTGFWGCGAFGGNRAVMVMLQLLAARLAKIERFGFYTVTPAGVPDFEAGRAALGEVRGVSVARFLDEVAGRGYRWGVSDGN